MNDPTPTARRENATPEKLQSLLPPLLANLSVGRAQIAIDQIRTTLADPQGGEIWLVTSGTSPDQPGLPAAAAIAIQTAQRFPTGGEGHSGSRGVLSDTVTVVHAGVTDHSSANDSPENPNDESKPSPKSSIRALADECRRQWAGQGVRFIQWASDPDPPESATAWQTGFGLENVATLDYLSGPIDSAVAMTSDASSKSKPEPRLGWTPVRPDGDASADKLAELADVIRRTYVETSDCPALAPMRTSAQTINGYRNAASLDPDGWWIAREMPADADPSAPPGQPVGCVIMAKHIADGSPPIAELVYMGVVPEARGRGIGQALFSKAADRATQIGSPQIILAVDRANHHAGPLYDRAGMKPMMSETVWCGSLA